MFKVSDECEKFGECDIESMKNDFSVAGRLNCEESIKFFQSIGASKLVLGARPGLWKVSEGPERRFERLAC